MSHWRRARLGDFFRLKHGYAFKSAYFADDADLIVVTPGNFFDAGGFKHKGEKEKFYRGPVPTGFVLRKGDLLVAMTEQAEGLLGSPAFIPENDKYLHNQRLGLVVDLDETTLDKQFLYYLFNLPLVRTQIRATANGAKVRHTSPARIYDVEARMPPLPTQRRIASILSAYDDLIENNTRRIAILEEMARRLYEEWFVRFRFPGHEEVEFEGELPSGWREVKLREVASVNPDTIKPKSAPDRIRYIDIASVSPGRIEEVREMAFEDAPGRARRRVRDGDIIWSCVRPNRRSHALVLEPEEDTVASTGFAVLRAESVPFSFLLAATTSDAFVDYLTNHATGAAYPAVKQSDFESADICLPTRELLDDYNEVVEPMRRLADALGRKNANLRAQRNLLLPKLVSGEIVVSTAEKNMEVAA